MNWILGVKCTWIQLVPYFETTFKVLLPELFTAFAFAFIIYLSLLWCFCASLSICIPTVWTTKPFFLFVFCFFSAQAVSQGLENKCGPVFYWFILLFYGALLVNTRLCVTFFVCLKFTGFKWVLFLSLYVVFSVRHWVSLTPCQFQWFHILRLQIVVGRGV